MVWTSWPRHTTRSIDNGSGGFNGYADKSAKAQLVRRVRVGPDHWTLVYCNCLSEHTKSALVFNSSVKQRKNKQRSCSKRLLRAYCAIAQSHLLYAERTQNDWPPGFSRRRLWWACSRAFFNRSKAERLMPRLYFDDVTTYLEKIGLALLKSYFGHLFFNSWGSLALFLPCSWASYACYYCTFVS